MKRRGISFENDIEWVWVLNLADKSIKMCILAAIHIYKTLSGNMGDAEKIQIKFKEESI